MRRLTPWLGAIVLASSACAAGDDPRTADPTIPPLPTLSDNLNRWLTTERQERLADLVVTTAKEHGWAAGCVFRYNWDEKVLNEFPGLLARQHIRSSKARSWLRHSSCLSKARQRLAAATRSGSPAAPTGTSLNDLLSQDAKQRSMLVPELDNGGAQMGEKEATRAPLSARPRTEVAKGGPPEDWTNDNTDDDDSPNRQAVEPNDSDRAMSGVKQTMQTQV